MRGGRRSHHHIKKRGAFMSADALKLPIFSKVQARNLELYVCVVRPGARYRGFELSAESRDKLEKMNQWDFQ